MSKKTIGYVSQMDLCFANKDITQYFTKTPVWDNLLSILLLIDASGSAVGLPNGQMESEVGHLNIGAKIVTQLLPKMYAAIESGLVRDNKESKLNYQD